MVSLGHVNIRTSRLDESVAFYRDVIGLSPGRAATRPQSDHHVWMSDDDGHPCIHLQRTDSEAAGTQGVASVHHIAFNCTDPDSWRAKLTSAGIEYKEARFAEADMLQFNLIDPNGVRLELLFVGAP
jgi:catechol 2,3-dioxygenase-like lactoylglutathione lyase family enzyme